MKIKARVIILWLISLIVFGLTLWIVTTPSRKDFRYLENIKGDVSKGKYVFNIAGCANCHSTLSSKIESALGGGMAFQTTFGTFYAPNISTSKEYGIGNWTINDFANALKKGIDPENEHYFPVFPYTSYRLISDKDLVDLWTFWQTLPAEEKVSRKHELKFPFSFRKSLVGWKFLYFDHEWVRVKTNPRGRYLVEALGHCAECHTSRSIFGGLNRDKWLQGGTNPTGNGKIPGIAPEILNWSKEDIVEFLTTGFTPEFDVVGGKMVRVVENTSRLSVADLDALANYLMKLEN